MNATQKTTWEQRAVVALVGVFVLAVAVALARLGVFSRPPAPSAISGAAIPDKIKSLPESLRSAFKVVEEAVDHAQQPSASAVRPIELPTVAYTAADRRDPMQSWLPPELPDPVLVPSDASASVITSSDEAAVIGGIPQEILTVSVEGIVWGGQTPQAIISGGVYSVGDDVRGARIVSIGPSGVTLEANGGLFLVGFSPATGSRPTP